VLTPLLVLGFVIVSWGLHSWRGTARATLPRRRAWTVAPTVALRQE
jgi:hypothetical protein